MKVISLFSGCGGLDLGFQKAGFDIVFANDINKDACETYAKNIGKHIVCGDIFEIFAGDIPNADVLIGGFPCLGFTIANGKNRDLGSKYNTLYLEFARILGDKKPKIFVAENVAGIQSGEAFKQNFEKKILGEFKARGYKVKYKLLNAKDYGVAQNRKRIIIIGVRNDLDVSVDFPKPTTLTPKTLREAIGDLPSDFDVNVPNHNGSNYKVKISNFMGDRALNWDKPSPTIIGRGSRGGGAVIHPHPNKHRRLSVRECARIQSFSDDFIFCGSISAAYAQIGNAVPPLMAYEIAKEVKKALEKSEVKKGKGFFIPHFLRAFLPKI